MTQVVEKTATLKLYFCQEKHGEEWRTVPFWPGGARGICLTKTEADNLASAWRNHRLTLSQQSGGPFRTVSVEMPMVVEE